MSNKSMTSSSTLLGISKLVKSNVGVMRSERFGKGLRSATMDDFPEVASNGEEGREGSEKEGWVDTNNRGVENKNVSEKTPIDQKRANEGQSSGFEDAEQST